MTTCRHPLLAGVLPPTTPEFFCVVRVLVAVVLSLQTSGPMLLEALRSQDQYLAGSFLMFLAVLTVIGLVVNLVSAGTPTYTVIAVA